MVPLAPVRFFFCVAGSSDISGSLPLPVDRKVGKIWVSSSAHLAEVL